jgi:membrane fusion protein, heavy metal efflux system
MNSKNIIAIGLVVLLGVVLAWLLLRAAPVGNQSESNGHEAHGGHEEEGGEMKHLSREGIEIEIGLSEDGGEPRFEATAFEDEQPIDPQEVQMTVTLKRPDGRSETLAFEPDGEHLKSLQTVPEPHLFKVEVTVRYQGNTYQWSYWQVEGGIELSASALKEARIELKTAGPAVIETVLTLPGQIQLDPRRVAHVVPRVEGVVTKVRKYLGDTVKAGEVLAVLESREIADLKSQYLVALRRLELANATLVRERQLWKAKVSAEQDYLVAKTEWAQSKALVEAAAQKLEALDLSAADLRAIASGKGGPFSRYVLRAPFAGEVVNKHLALGEAVKADTKVYTIADLSRVWGEITVYSKDLNAVRKGQMVTVRVEDTGETTKGTVFYVEPLVGKQTRSAKAYVEIANPRRRWRPGLFLTVEVLQEQSQVPVAVAVEAVQTYKEKPVVFVRYDDIFEPRPVVLGRRGEQWVEIRQGLAAGERYASRNSFVLKSELGKSTAAHSH